jgi:hypothetical protein
MNGDLSPAEMDAVMAHLDACPDCEAAFRDFLQARVLQGDIEKALPAGFFPERDVAGPFRRLYVHLAVAAVLLVMLTAGLFLVKGYLAEQAGANLGARLEDGPYPFERGVYRGGGAPPADRDRLMEPYSRAAYPAFLEAADAWLETHPGDERVLFYSGVAAYLLHRHPEAARRLEAALRASTERKAEVLWYLANTRLRTGDTRGGRQLLEELARGPDPVYGPKAAGLLAIVPGP